jgi:hypothetical protein
MFTIFIGTTILVFIFSAGWGYYLGVYRERAIWVDKLYGGSDLSFPEICKYADDVSIAHININPCMKYIL